ncbi:MAG: Nif3-like dinuclear metal center hexameric protein [Flavobacteriaceae bacterium]|nr:Nif3-like dinuclear metal center hexameric protein [Flavobacteriaceae bacterium]
MKIKEVIHLLENLAPLAYSEDFDNTGLLVGNYNTDVSGILVTLDTLEDVVDEAIANNCNLIVSFHPIIFSGLKKLTGKNYVERVVIKAIQNNIAIFSMHTALDNSWNGVNAMICEKLGLINRKILIPKKETIKKLTTYVPTENAEKVRNALFKAGAGNIGNYSNCSFNTEGKGSFKGGQNSKPAIGKIGELHFENETQISVTFHKHTESSILQAMFKSHPYEEVAYEINTLENTNQHLGMGMIAELETPISEKEFLKYLKITMKTDCVRHSKLLKKSIKKIAVLGGSGSFAINAAKQAGADVFITADCKYHDFFNAENDLLLADIGHYESEQYTKELLVAFLSEKISTFAVVLSQTNTNPITYF